jgi:hypothetical protein
MNSEVHHINTRGHLNLHHPALTLTGYQQEIHYSGVRIYNNLPPHIKQLSDDLKNLKLQLKNYLYL